MLLTRWYSGAKIVLRPVSSMRTLRSSLRHPVASLKLHQRMEVSLSMVVPKLWLLRVVLILRVPCQDIPVNRQWLDRVPVAVATAAMVVAQACLLKAMAKCRARVETCQGVRVVMDATTRCSPVTAPHKALVAILLVVKEPVTLDIKLDHQNYPIAAHVWPFFHKILHSETSFTFR